MRSDLGTENMKVSDLLRNQGRELSFKFFGVVVSRSVSVVIVHLVMAFLNLNLRGLYTKVAKTLNQRDLGGIT